MDWLKPIRIDLHFFLVEETIWLAVKFELNVIVRLKPPSFTAINALKEVQSLCTGFWTFPLIRIPNLWIAILP